MFKLQIVYPDGTPVRFSAGEAVEMDLRKAIKDAILKRGVGFWRTEAHVATDIEAGIAEALDKFKAQAVPGVVG
jgi:hypothetical protein